MKIGKKMQ